jgi:hypothetical protein
MTHFPELDVALEVLGSRRSAGLIEDEVHSLRSRVLAVVESLASHVHSSVAHNPPHVAGE